MLRPIALCLTLAVALNAAAQSAPTTPKVPTTPIDPNKLKPPVTAPQPETTLDVYVFDSSKNGNSGVEVKKNGMLWGNCKWSGPNAKPAKLKIEAGEPEVRVCKFAAPRGTKVSLSQSPGGSTLSAIICATGAAGMCYSSYEFELQRDGYAVGAFNYKP